MHCYNLVLPYSQELKLQYYGCLTTQVQEEEVREWGDNDITTFRNPEKRHKAEGIQFRNCFCFLPWQLKGIENTLSLTL